MSEVHKPIPHINGDNKEFWAGCKDHELRFQKCKTCGHVRWPASFICPICYSKEIEWIVSGGKGKVYTFIVYHVAYDRAFESDLPYVVADVELEEGPRLVTNMVRCEMPVEVMWQDITEEFSLPKFKPRSQTI